MGLLNLVTGHILKEVAEFSSLFLSAGHVRGWLR